MFCPGAGGSLTKTGTGTLILNATNTYTGATVVNGGKLVLQISATLKISSSVTVTGTGLLGINQGSESGQFAAGVVIQGTGGVVNDINNANKRDSLLDRANTYTGQTTWGCAEVSSLRAWPLPMTAAATRLSGAFGVNSNINFTGQQARLNLNGLTTRWDR